MRQMFNPKASLLFDFLTDNWTKHWSSVHHSPFPAKIASVCKSPTSSLLQVFFFSERFVKLSFCIARTLLWTWKHVQKSDCRLPIPNQRNKCASEVMYAFMLRAKCKCNEYVRSNTIIMHVSVCKHEKHLS